MDRITERAREFQLVDGGKGKIQFRGNIFFFFLQQRGRIVFGISCDIDCFRMDFLSLSLSRYGNLPI